MRTRRETPTIGSTIRTKQVAVTLHAATQVLTRADVEVEVCNRTKRAQPLRRTQFFLQVPDGHLVLPDESTPKPHPQFRTAPLPARRCARGWLGYTLPPGVVATRLVFQAGAMFTDTLHTWELGTN